MPDRTVSVIIPALNEIQLIDHVLDVALSSDVVGEVIVVDGGSLDGTTDRVRQRQATDDRLTLLHNPEGHQATGFNLGALAATGDTLVRMDAHTRYAEDYVTASVQNRAEDVAVGGPMVADGNNNVASAIANAMRDPLAIGPARFHHAADSEEVDTVFLGAFSRKRFLAVGGYRRFPSGTCEDADFYQRWRRRGGTVIVDPAVRSWYQPRTTLRGLALQYLRYGRGKAEMMWTDRRLPSLRPLPPAALVAALVIGIVVGFTWSWVPVGAIVLAWLAALGVVAVRSRSHRLLTGVVAGTMHIFYGIGFWVGLLSGRPTVTSPIGG
jgi:glycosyltransferase involved in cell wall biosynthesis